MFIDYSNERSLRYEMEQIASLTLTDSVQALVRARNLHDYVSAAGSEDKPQYSRELAEETEELYADTLRLVEENFYTAVSDGDWTDASRFYRSLAVFQRAPPDWNERRIAENRIAQWRTEGNITLAELSSVRPSTPEDEAPAQDVISSLISATVTVWVDRGLSIQRGIGYANHVIGSGFFIDRRGYLVTNYHVISSEVDPDYEGYSRLYIRLAENPDARIPARVVGWDPVFDLALLKTEITPPEIFQLGSSADLRVGTRIYAIGSPAGLDQTITSGIVSAQDRRLLSLGGVLQIDAPINHGNSGGPIIDEAGRVQAVVFAGIESFEGLNFAIPVELLKLILPQLYAGGLVSHPWLGAYGKTFAPPADPESAGVSFRRVLRTRTFAFPSRRAGRCGDYCGQRNPRTDTGRFPAMPAYGISRHGCPSFRLHGREWQPFAAGMVRRSVCAPGKTRRRHSGAGYAKPCVSSDVRFEFAADWFPPAVYGKCRNPRQHRG